MSVKAMRRFVVALLLLASGAHAADCPRIISQAPFITKTLQWLGLQRCIVGVSRYDALDLPRTGGLLDPDADTIALLQPQLLLGSDWIPAAKWRAMAPAGAAAITLHGFQSMDQIEENLRVIGRAVHLPDADQRAAAFGNSWRRAAAQVHGDGRRVLLLSACSGSGYSFGRKTWLYDLFTKAGFDVVETAATIRQLTPAAPIADVNTLIATLHPQVLFLFERSDTKQCRLLLPKTPLRIVALDSDHFLDPAPTLLLGLDDLRTRRAQWDAPSANTKAGVR